MSASLHTPGSPALPGPAELPDVDRRIALAYTDLGLARSRFAEAPSGEGVTACETAEAAVNELLELRLALTLGEARLSA